MLKEKIAIIGAGKIGSALIRGIVQADLVNKRQVMASDPREVVRRALAKDHGVRVTGSNREAVAFADIVILTVKPQLVESVLEEVGEIIIGKKLLVSVAAGVPLARLEGCLPQESRAVRVMTNTPCLIGAAASAYAGGTHATKDDLKRVETILKSVGVALPLEECHLDAVTGLSGSGPAYVFLFIESLADGGVQTGLSRQVALQLALQTVYGSAKLACDSERHLAQLKDEITSPGGTTIAGLYALEKGRLRGTVMDAVLQATNRSRALGRGES
ncbi:MAG: pyrroline-5-carboxylate reductase [Candidatus Binatia bacterium]|jgi:pyrroline-5-carboxylate reductase|nr:pyrroline-5-carboxylate reductase [Candidatus Binatia bacterium]